MKKKHILFWNPMVYAIYYRDANVIYYNLAFASDLKLFVIK